MIKVVSSLRSAHHAVSVAIDGKDISDDMRRSLELVRTCNQDLQELISLRNEQLHMLEKQPQTLERLNSIIEKVHEGLRDASNIVEKYRSYLHSGKKSLHPQIAWAHRDSQEFQTLGPTMSQHNATILAEISFLRSLTTVTTESKFEEAREIAVLSSDDKTLFDNLELLEDFLGDVSGSLVAWPSTVCINF
jgi:ABC-type transporter Mla subunit MlaD